MWQWLDDLWEAIQKSNPSQKHRLLHRKFHLSDKVVLWFRGPECTDIERFAFVELILKLDSDPFAHSFPVLQSNAVPGTRWAPFDAHKTILIWDPTENEICFLICT